MNLKQMEYFTAIVSEGSISGAARVLHISQPPLSAQMRLLEEELGVTLFDRGSRSIQLTEAGRLFYDRAASILDMTRAARKDLEQLGEGLLGTLRLGMISSVETQEIITSIASFRERYPKVSFRIYEGNTYQLLDKLSTGQIDAALVRTPFPEEAYDCRYLEEEPMMAVGRADFFSLDCGAQIPLKELAALPLIIYRRWESVLGRLFPNPQPEYLCVNDDARTSLIWAASGAGVAVVPASIVRGAWEQAGETPPWGRAPLSLAAKVICDPPLTSTITLVKLKNAGLSAIGQHFFQYFSIPKPEPR
ncbi:MAG: LysR family transcriptional regulator [Enterocloster asparagiformis]|nr:LysR family transcriptional regulator [Enterocloster asparagiformis]